MVSRIRHGHCELSEEKMLEERKRFYEQETKCSTKLNEVKNMKPD